MDFDPKAGFYRLSHIYKEAIRNKCLIYHKEQRRWFTPEQFKKEYEGTDLRHNQVTGLLEELSVRDPIAGINAAHKQINDRVEKFRSDIQGDLDRLAEFSKMVVKHYQDKTK